ncbi:hypothetical protein QAD02_007355 [Eretmocerus hayati]|uniref:Uncharacterized protein n=1 Tax=Eretmocerus hayati TaxID=131215 RepID=A0ACC2N3F6_9HYME|nr:hypothetical protein QAD02_007355 [Eretmocerus hayati]
MRPSFSRLRNLFYASFLIDSIISFKLIQVPTTSPTQPNRMSPMPLTSTILHGPSLSGHITQISMIAGNAIPEADRQRAPTSEMNKPRRGTAIAKMTVKKENTES